MSITTFILLVNYVGTYAAKQTKKFGVFSYMTARKHPTPRAWTANTCILVLNRRSSGCSPSAHRISFPTVVAGSNAYRTQAFLPAVYGTHSAVLVLFLLSRQLRIFFATTSLFFKTTTLFLNPHCPPFSPIPTFFVTLTSTAFV